MNSPRTGTAYRSSRKSCVSVVCLPSVSLHLIQIVAWIVKKLKTHTKKLQQILLELDVTRNFMREILAPRPGIAPGIEEARWVKSDRYDGLTG